MSQPVTGSDYCKCFIAAAANDSQLTLRVTNPTEPFPSFDADHTYFYLTIVDAASYAVDAIPPAQREIVKVTAYVSSGSGYELTVERAITTTAQIWAVGAVCEIRPCEQWLEDLKGGGGFIQASYATVTDESGSLTNARQLVAGLNVTLTDSGAGGTLTIAANAGTGAPVDATYVTLSTNSTLTQERVLTAGTGISVTDAGANSTVTVANTALGESYVVIGTSALLTADRVLTAGTGITITDGGANSTVTIAATGGGGGTLKGVEFTADDTWDVPTGVTSLWLTMIGGGGGGGSTNTTQGGGGGGSGEFVEQFGILAVSEETLTITIGAGGTGGTNAVGGNGGDTSVAATSGTYYARGGYGAGVYQSASGGGYGHGGGSGGGAGIGLLGSQESNSHYGGTGGGAGGAGNNAGTSGGANAGYPAIPTGGSVGAGSTGGGGGGANSPYGVGPNGGNGAANGNSATASHYGASGSGAGGTTTTAFTGGDGAPGYVLIQWVG